jgi:hypothetical protein
VKPGDLVSVLYETRRFYIVLEKLPREELPFGEQMYRLLGLKDGVKRDVRYSEIKIVNSAKTR